MTVTKPHWKDVAERKLQIRDDLIQKYEAARSAQDTALSAQQHGSARDLTSTSRVQDILQEIASGAVTAKELCVAYIDRAIKAHQQTNVLTEILFDDALKRAAELDEFFREHGRLVGPLHGVPMTLKDQFDVKGYDSTLGYVGRAFKPAAEDAVIVHLLKQMGAVIIAKSNLPQSIMWCETENPLWGLTVHPKNPEFTAGGSTAGEANLLALQGSVVGWGTDIGGSIRMPAHMVGVYGLKPSSTRLPYQGVSVSTEGQEHVPSVIGPMSRSIESLIDVTRAVIEARPNELDPKCCPLPWRDDRFQSVQSRPLVVALMTDDGVVRPHPPVSRVLSEVAKKLEAAGHEVIPWQPGKLHQECIDIMDQYYTADGGEDIRRDVEAAGEPYIPHVEALVNRGKPISVYSYWQLNKQRNAAQKRFLDRWNSTVSPSGKKIDVLLCPVLPHSAVPHRKARWVGYTKVFNFVDYPGVVIPAGSVDKNIDRLSPKEHASYQPRNELLDKWNWNLYDVDAMDGMPIGVQIVSRRLEEETALGAARVIDTLLKT